MYSWFSCALVYMCLVLMAHGILVPWEIWVIVNLLHTIFGKDEFGQILVNMKVAEYGVAPNCFFVCVI